MYQRVSLVVLAAVAALACGLPPLNDAPPAGTRPQAGSTGHTSKPPADSGPKKRHVIPWIVELGPGTPRGPAAKDEVNVYQAVQGLDCQPTDGTKRELHGDGFDVYVGLIAACMAAFHGAGPKAWDTAEEGLAAPARDGVCLDAPVRALLHRLIEAHRAAPARPFVADTGSRAGAPTTCPRITRISLAPSEDGRTTVTIHGKHLAGVSDIEILKDDWEPVGSTPPTTVAPGRLEAPLPPLDAGTDTSTVVWIGIRDKANGLIASRWVSP